LKKIQQIFFVDYLENIGKNLLFLRLHLDIDSYSEPNIFIRFSLTFLGRDIL